MSLHLGFHWSMMLAMARKHGWLGAAYGAFAFRRRGVSLYLLLRSHFVFYDYSEPLIAFLLDYLAVMGLFVAVGFLLLHVIKPARSAE